MDICIIIFLRTGKYLKDGLIEMSKIQPCLDDVQGIGLMIGAEIISDKNSQTPASNDILETILDEMLKQNILIGRGGLYYNRVRFQPPLSFTIKEADRVLCAFEKTMNIIKRKI